MPAVQGVTSNFINGATSMTLTYPASIAATDLVLCVIVWRAAAANTLTPPTGFTQVGGSTTGSSTNPNLWVGRMFGTGGGTTATFSSTSGAAWAILRISGVDQTTPVEASTFGAVGASTTTYTVPGQTSTAVTAAALIVNLFLARLVTTTGQTATWTPPAGTVEQADVSSAQATTAQATLEVVTEVQSTAGSNAQRTATLVPSSGTPSIIPQSAVLSIRDAGSAAAARPPASRVLLQAVNRSAVI